MNRASATELDRSTGAPWALLPGWGMTAATLRPLATALEPGRVVLVAWPREERVWQAALDGQWEPFRAHLAEQVGAPALWLGWSLGGLVLGQLLSMEQTTFPALGAVFLGSGPRFVRRTPSSWGLPRAELRAFSQAFQRNPSAAWRRFLLWQSSGEVEPETCRAWLEEATGDPTLKDRELLRSGLRLLAETDFSSGLGAPKVPHHFVRGARDPLCPEWGELETSTSPELRWTTLEDAGHVPQWQSAPALAEALRAWRGEIGV